MSPLPAVSTSAPGCSVSDQSEASSRTQLQRAPSAGFWKLSETPFVPKLTVSTRLSPVASSSRVTTAVPGTASACLTDTLMAGSAATASTTGALPAFIT